LSSVAEKILEAPPLVKELQPESYSNLPTERAGSDLARVEHFDWFCNQAAVE
jgi:hypothetical protein